MRPLTSLTPRPTARPAARPRRGAVLVAAVGTAAVVLAACSTGTPGPASSGTGGAASRSTAASNAAPAAVVPLPPVLDQRSVSGLVPEQDSTNDPTDRRSIATVSVAGDPTLDDRLTQLADVQTPTTRRAAATASPTSSTSAGTPCSPPARPSASASRLASTPAARTAAR